LSRVTTLSSPSNQCWGQRTGFKRLPRLRLAAIGNHHA
jgi:hypothetical protein